MSDALHELVKGMPDSPDLSLMAELFEDFDFELPECESPVVEQYIAAPQPKMTLISTVSCVFQTSSTQSSACQNPTSQISVERRENDSISVQPELVLPPIHRKESMQGSICFPEVSKSTYDVVTENENKNTTLKTVGHELLQ